MRWKFKTESGNIEFGVQRRECARAVQLREEVLSYHILAKDKEKEKSVQDESAIPEIHINDDVDEYNLSERRVKMRYRASKKLQRECAVELLEEVDEVGSFVEDENATVETVISKEKVRYDFKFCSIKNQIPFRCLPTRNYNLDVCNVSLATHTYSFLTTLRASSGQKT